MNYLTQRQLKFINIHMDQISEAVKPWKGYATYKIIPVIKVATEDTTGQLQDLPGAITQVNVPEIEIKITVAQMEPFNFYFEMPVASAQFRYNDHLIKYFTEGLINRLKENAPTAKQWKEHEEAIKDYEPLPF